MTTPLQLVTYVTFSWAKTQCLGWDCQFDLTTNTLHTLVIDRAISVTRVHLCVPIFRHNISKLLGSLLLICTSWSPGGLCVFYLFSGRHVQDKYTDKMCSTNTLNIYRGEEIGYSYFWHEFQITLGLRATLRFMVFSRSNPKH